MRIKVLLCGLISICDLYFSVRNPLQYILSVYCTFERIVFNGKTNIFLFHFKKKMHPSQSDFVCLQTSGPGHAGLYLRHRGKDLNGFMYRAKFSSYLETEGT